MTAAWRKIVAYYVDRDEQGNGVHIVHRTGCWQSPVVNNRLYLGVFSDCREAVQKAKGHYPQSEACADCCRQLRR